MFDDVFEMVERATETFRGVVQDAFGASIIADVLDPIRHHIAMLRSIHEDFQRDALNVAQLLQEVRSMTVGESSEE